MRGPIASQEEGAARGGTASPSPHGWGDPLFAFHESIERVLRGMAKNAHDFKRAVRSGSVPFMRVSGGLKLAAVSSSKGAGCVLLPHPPPAEAARANSPDAFAESARKPIFCRVH